MKYLICETTKEEREKLVYKALGISMSDAKSPSNKALQLAKEYIDGKKELEEVQKEIIEMYRSGE